MVYISLKQWCIRWKNDWRSRGISCKAGKFINDGKHTYIKLCGEETGGKEDEILTDYSNTSYGGVCKIPKSSFTK